MISIHAPRTGSDGTAKPLDLSDVDFNPRSPHGERRARCFCRATTAANFNPRSPHGERPLPCASSTYLIYFNPRSPHGERLPPDAPPVPDVPHFNPRSPHGERHSNQTMAKYHNKFQSTLPARGATAFRDVPRATVEISIHAPRTGSDRIIISDWLEANEFQSTLPARGATCTGDHQKQAKKTFQSTLPARGATTSIQPARKMEGISIHAPRTGSDRDVRIFLPRKAHFNPRSPHGERLFSCFPVGRAM